MRGLFLVPDINDNPGIFSKVKKQISEFKNHGYDIQVYIDEKQNKVNKIQSIAPIGSKQFFNLSNINTEDYEFAYIRKPKYIDFHFINFLKKLKKSSVTILLEIPTYPYEHEFRHPCLLGYAILKDRYWRAKLNKYVNRIVTYSNDLTIFGIKTICLSNGYRFSRDIEMNKKLNPEKINIIAVANMAEWHGYDRLIEGLYLYTNEKKDSDPYIDIYIVGNGNEKVIKKYNYLISKYKINDNIHYLSQRTGEGLTKLYENADIAVDSLGRHRSKVYYNSSLKGKEYLNYGLPIISGVETELDAYGEKFPYYLRVPANDTPINFFNVVKFYNDVYSYNNTRKEVSSKIKKFGKENFSYSNTMSVIFEYIDKNC